MNVCVCSPEYEIDESADPPVISLEELFARSDVISGEKNALTDIILMS
jgi:hypothetical protein